jgi:hypothetical protein
MQSGILPFRPVLRDFIRNLWVLRFFFLLIAALQLGTSALMACAQGVHPAADGAAIGFWNRIVGVTLDGFFFGFGQGYVPLTALGRTAQILNSFLNKLILGVLLWVVQQSLSGHALKKSKFMLFPTEQDL